MVWRIWQTGRETLFDLEERWSLEDLYKAHLVLDFESEVERVRAPKPKK